MQGAGGGGLQPSEQAILADTFPPAKRGMAFAVYGVAVVTAPAIGPPSAVGSPIISPGAGFLHQYPGWYYSILLTSRLIRTRLLQAPQAQRTTIDYVGWVS